MFHSEDGLFFGRGAEWAEDSVVITKTSDGKEPQEDGGNVVFSQTLPAGSWCSAVCCVSKNGEGNLRWYDAMDFHGAVQK